MQLHPNAPPLGPRTRTYALNIIGFYADLPRTTVQQLLGRQLLRSATSVGAQYREARRARCVADFVSKSEGALQELEEAAYWLELLSGNDAASEPRRAALYSETQELISIFIVLVRKAKITRDKRRIVH
jgi:four helix bundle protein